MPACNTASVSTSTAVYPISIMEVKGLEFEMDVVDVETEAVLHAGIEIHV